MIPRPAAVSLRKIEPFLAAPVLVDVVAATATAMSNALAPISFAAAARELIARGSAVLDATLAQGHPVSWRALHPPRGRRKAGAPRAVSAPDVFVLVSPLALPEALIRQLKALRDRLERAASSPVSIAMVVREAITVGHEARERDLRRAQEIWAQQAAALRAAGLPVPAEPIAATPVLIARYARGPTDPWATAPPRTKRAPSPSKAAKNASRTAPRARARSPRRRAATRRADRTEGSDDDGAEPPRSAGAPELLAHTPADALPLTDSDRRLLDHLIDMALRA